MTADPPRIGLGLMCKPPRPGTSKTRLAASMGPERAAAFATAFLRDAVATLEAAATSPGIHPYAFYKPAGAEEEMRAFVPPAIPLVLQDGADLGTVMFAALEHMLGQCPDGAILFGSDLPSLPAALLVEAAERLSAPGERVVLGPSEDGGYFLVGIKSAAAVPLFAPMAWSTPTVMAETRQRALTAKLDLVEVIPWYDVDDAESLERLRADLARPDGAAGLGPARATRALLGL